MLNLAAKPRTQAAPGALAPRNGPVTEVNQSDVSTGSALRERHLPRCPSAPFWASGQGHPCPCHHTTLMPRPRATLGLPRLRVLSSVSGPLWGHRRHGHQTSSSASTWAKAGLWLPHCGADTCTPGAPRHKVTDNRTGHRLGGPWGWGRPGQVLLGHREDLSEQAILVTETGNIWGPGQAGDLWAKAGQSTGSRPGTSSSTRWGGGTGAMLRCHNQRLKAPDKLRAHSGHSQSPPSCAPMYCKALLSE